jgi:DNA-binding transcriptional ArsR family regulator
MAPESSILAALASPRRRETLRLVWHGELTAGAIHQAMPDVTFGAVSLQLRSLREAGLVEARSEKRNRLYRARPRSGGHCGRDAGAHVG